MKALEARERKRFGEALGDQGARIARTQKRLSEIQEFLQGAAVMAGFVDFAEIDWQAPAKLLANLEGERETLRKSNDLLASLRAQQEAVEAALAENRSLAGRLWAGKRAAPPPKTEAAKLLLEEALALMDSGGKPGGLLRASGGRSSGRSGRPLADRRGL